MELLGVDLRTGIIVAPLFFEGLEDPPDDDGGPDARTLRYLSAASYCFFAPQLLAVEAYFYYERSAAEGESLTELPTR